MLEGYWVLGGGRPPLPSTQRLGFLLLQSPTTPTTTIVLYRNLLGFFDLTAPEHVQCLQQASSSDTFESILTTPRVAVSPPWKVGGRGRKTPFQDGNRFHRRSFLERQCPSLCREPDRRTMKPSPQSHFDSHKSEDTESLYATSQYF